VYSATLLRMAGSANFASIFSVVNFPVWRELCSLSRLGFENIKALENAFADVTFRQACLLGNIPEGFAIKMFFPPYNASNEILQFLCWQIKWPAMAGFRFNYYGSLFRPAGLEWDNDCFV